INARYKITPIVDTKKNVNSSEESDTNVNSYPYKDAYILLTIKFYKPFLQRLPKHPPLKMYLTPQKLDIQHKKEIHFQDNNKISKLFN
ncbi:conserved protein, unknown function, partial [Hepatocystis sp. ex Piliocolobus tephrosceles]